MYLTRRKSHWWTAAAIRMVSISSIVAVLSGLSELRWSISVREFHARNVKILVLEVFRPHDGEPSGRSFLDGCR